MRSLKNLESQILGLERMVVNKVKLGRKAVFSSFGELFTEPNIGPFPQFNIQIEDVPIDEQLRSTPVERLYKSPTRSALVQMLKKSTNDLIRLQTIVENPRTKKQSSPKWSKMFSSFFQDHEQYIEENPPPFQQIVIHPESVVPDGGNAPLTPGFLSRTQILNLNATLDDLELKALMTQELVMIKALSLLTK